MGLMEIVTAYKAAIVSLAQYIRAKTDNNKKHVHKHQELQPVALSILKLADIFMSGEERGKKQVTTKARIRRKKFIEQQQDEGVDRWRCSRRVGPFAELMQNENIDEKS